MLILINLILLITFSFLLIKATQLLITSLKKISLTTGLGKFALASILISLATSLPELFVSITAAFSNEQNLALGNILGSNIADISLILGGVVLVGGKLSVRGDYLKKDLLIVFLASTLPLILILDKQLSRLDGLLLLLIFWLYNYSVYRQSAARKNFLSEGESRKSIKKELFTIFAAAGMLLISAEIIVKSAVGIALWFNLPIFLAGLFFVAIGTSLPELVFEMSAIKHKEMAMVFGDSLGSLVANATLILGLTVLINPITIVSHQELFLATLIFVVAFSLFWFFSRTKKKLERWEGLVLLLVYVVFAFLEFYQR